MIISDKKVGSSKALQNLTIFLLPTERVAFYNVTGGLPLGEGKLPHGYVAEKTSPGASELKKTHRL
jgi:hypothetical protein